MTLKWRLAVRSYHHARHAHPATLTRSQLVTLLHEALPGYDTEQVATPATFVLRMTLYLRVAFPADTLLLFSQGLLKICTPR